jgi:hypothetical protein
MKTVLKLVQNKFCTSGNWRKRVQKWIPHFEKLENWKSAELSSALLEKVQNWVLHFWKKWETEQNLKAVTAVGTTGSKWNKPNIWAPSSVSESSPWLGK